MSVSVKDVAALAGVSVGTVSNVLNRPDRVAPATVERVQAAIATLGFVRNDAARQLRAGRSRSIGLVVLDVGNPFFTDLARGAERRAAENDLSVLLGNSDSDPSRESRYLDLFEEQRVQGVLISPIEDVSARLRRLQMRGIPAVLVDRPSETREVSSVAVDDVAGGYLAALHLLEIGRRRIAFVGGPASTRQVVDRLSGARRAVEEQPHASLEIVETGALTVLEGRAAGEQMLSRAPSRRPDAVFAANDLLAVGVLQALVMLGSISVPDDVAIIGYDDIDFVSTSVVPLSSIRQPSELIGRRAVELLLSVIEDESAIENVVFQPELVERQSTRGRGEA